MSSILVRAASNSEDLEPIFRLRHDPGPRMLLDRLQEAVAEFDRVINTCNGDKQLDYCRVTAAVRQLCSLIRLAELTGVSRDTVRRIVEPVREIHSLSPFISRIQKWPRKYMGDFETIEYLCAGVCNAKPNTPGAILEHVALNCVAAQQHRYKVVWAGEQAVNTAYKSCGARILSVACGGSLDLRRVERLLADRGVVVCLNDSDADALHWSAGHLPQLSSSCTYVLGNVFRSVSKLMKYAPFDLIIAGGLFDYLTDKQLVWLLPRLVDLLSPDGELCFTNIAADNIDRVWMEYMANWLMIERTENDVASLIRKSLLSAKVLVDVCRDPSGTTLLVKLKRKRLIGKRKIRSKTNRVNVQESKELLMRKAEGEAGATGEDTKGTHPMCRTEVGEGMERFFFRFRYSQT